jgi:hypothetical protein
MWIAAQLRELGFRALGPIEQVRVRPWSLVLSVPTDRGRLFFKANEPAFRHEGALEAFLAARCPDVVPAPLAVDPATGWMLMADAGVQLRELIARERRLDPWLEVLPRYARLQVALAPDAEALIALGTPDLRLACLPDHFEALIGDLERLDHAAEHAHADDVLRLRDQIPHVAAMAEALAGFRIPETIEHDDLHDAAVHVDGDRYWVIDWGDACVSHPLFSLSVPLEGVIAWGVDDVQGSVDVAPYREAYLAAFAAAGGWPLRDLRVASEIALRLGWVCRAVNDYERAGEVAGTWTRLHMAFDGHP